MSAIFQQTVEELWRLTDLGKPPVAQDGTTSLVFDDVVLDFATAPSDEEMWITADAGPIKGSQADQSKKIERILGVSFALLASYDVLLTLENEQIFVSGSYRYDDQNLPVLTGLLSDVVSAAETVKRLLTDVRSHDVRQAPETLMQNQEFVVFQP